LRKDEQREDGPCDYEASSLSPAVVREREKRTGGQKKVMGLWGDNDLPDERAVQGGFLRSRKDQERVHAQTEPNLISDSK